MSELTQWEGLRAGCETGSEALWSPQRLLVISDKYRGAPEQDADRGASGVSEG